MDNNFNNNKDQTNTQQSFYSKLMQNIQTNRFQEEYILNLEYLISENKNLTELIEKFKNENFRTKNDLKNQLIEKQDFIYHIKAQDEKEENFKHRIIELEQIIKIQKEKEENFKKTMIEYFEKESDYVNLLNGKNEEIEKFKKELDYINKTYIVEKDNLILLKVNEINNLLQIKSDYENKIVYFNNECEKQKEINRDLNLKIEIINSEKNLELQLKMNQIIHLNENLVQLNKEMDLIKENNIRQIQNLENKKNELSIEKDLIKSQTELLNGQIHVIKKNLQIKEMELEEKLLEISNLKKIIEKLNQELKLNSEMVLVRDLEISRIMKYKEKYEKYVYIEKNLDIFKIINAADLNVLQEEFKKLYTLNKENKTQLENLTSINESLRKDSQELSLLKGKYKEIESDLKKRSHELTEIKLKNFEIEIKCKDINGEICIYKDLNKRLSDQNKNLLFESKIKNSNFNILNSAIGRNKADYEKFLYSNIEDMEAKSTILHQENIKFKNIIDDLNIEIKNNLENISEKDCLIREQREYIESLESNLKEINDKLKTLSYYNQCGLSGFNHSIFSEENYGKNEESNKLSAIVREKNNQIEEFKNKCDLYDKMIKEKNEDLNIKNEENLANKNQIHELYNELGKYKHENNSFKIEKSNLENQMMIKDNYVNSTILENKELKNKLEKLQTQRDSIFTELSNNSKDTIQKLNDHKLVFIEKIENLLQENKNLKETMHQFSENLINLIPKMEESIKFENGLEKPRSNENFDCISFNNYCNLLSCLNNNEREILFLKSYNNEQNFRNVKRKFEVLQKILSYAEKSLQSSQEQKIKLDNLSSLVNNLQLNNQVYQSKILFLENLITQMNEKEEKRIVNKNSLGTPNKLDIINFEQNQNSPTGKKDFSALKITNTSVISSHINDYLLNEKNKNNQVDEENDFESKNFQLSLIDRSEFLKKYFEVLRNNDSLRIVNIELNAKINQIKQQNHELINSKFQNRISGSGTSKFFFDKYNELLLEKVNLENIITNNKTELEKMLINVNELNKEIFNLKVEKKDLENLYSELEKKSDKDNIANMQNQENLMKQIDELKQNIQVFYKEKTNFNNVFNKIKADKINLENINRNNLNEIMSLKENIIHKDEELNSLKSEIEILNKKLAEQNNLRIELENKVKNAGEAKNNIWVRKLCTILNKSRAIIEIFIQLKNNLENKIKNYENALNSNQQAKQANLSLYPKLGEVSQMNTIFSNSLIEINSKMQKCDQEFKIYKKKEENLEKKINNLLSEVNLLQEKDRKLSSELKLIKDKENLEAKNPNYNVDKDTEKENSGGNVATSNNVKTYFNKLIKYLTTAQNMISFKDNIIKKLENENLALSTKLNEEKNQLINLQTTGCYKCSVIVTQNKKLMEINNNFSKTIDEQNKERSDLININTNKIIENITLTKDINGIVKYLNEVEQTPSTNQNKQDENKIQNGVQNQQIFYEVNKNISNQSKQKGDFSTLFLLMRKASKLLNLFDNKVKLVSDKLSE